MGDSDRFCHAAVARPACLYMLSHFTGRDELERRKDLGEGIARSTI